MDIPIDIKSKVNKKCKELNYTLSYSSGSTDLEKSNARGYLDGIEFLVRMFIENRM